MRKKVKKKVVALAVAGVMILGICPTCLAAGTVTKKIDNATVTASSSISGATAYGSMESTAAGTMTITLKYRYKVKGSMTLKDGSKTVKSKKVIFYETSVAPTDSEKMYEVSGTHTVTINDAMLSIYT